MRMKMFGGGLVKTSPRPQKQTSMRESVTVSRMWRLGDIIMCEPVTRLLGRQDRDVFFATRHEYFPVISSFSSPPKGMISHGMAGDNIVDLDVVGLVHPGFDSKIDAFLAAAKLSPENLTDEDKRPKIEVGKKHQIWAQGVISAKNIPERFVSMVLSSHDSRSPRSLSRKLFEEVCEGITEFYDVVVVGVKPTRLGLANDKIHNLTGCTPDVMSLAGIFSLSGAVVSVDTGTMHLAGAAGVPLVSLLGPTLPKDVCSYYSRTTCLFADPGSCSPCYDRGCDSPCLERIGAEEIVMQVEARVSSPDHPSTLISLGR